MFCRLRYHRLIAYPHEGFEQAITQIIVWCIVPRQHVKKKNFFSIHLLHLHVDLRNRVYALFYLLADEFRVFLGIFQSDDSVVIRYTKKQTTAVTIGKGAYTFQPTLHFAVFHFLFFVIFSGFSYEFLDIHNYVLDFSDFTRFLPYVTNVIILTIYTTTSTL